MSDKCPTCGQSVQSFGFAVGDRVRHKARASSVVNDTGEGVVVEIGKGPSGEPAVHVLFDYVAKSGSQATGVYDELWFRMHPDMLEKI